MFGEEIHIITGNDPGVGVTSYLPTLLEGCVRHKSEGCCISFQLRSDQRKPRQLGVRTYRTRHLSGVPTVWYLCWLLNQRDISCVHSSTHLQEPKRPVVNITPPKPPHPPPSPWVVSEALPENRASCRLLLLPWTDVNPVKSWAKFLPEKGW